MPQWMQQKSLSYFAFHLEKGGDWEYLRVAILNWIVREKLTFEPRFAIFTGIENELSSVYKTIHNY